MYDLNFLGEEYMQIVYESIERFHYIEDIEKLLLQTYIIGKVMKRRLTYDLLCDVYPDDNVVYIVKFILGLKLYISVNFKFEGKTTGYILCNGKLLYGVNPDTEKLEYISKDVPENAEESTQINEWFDNRNRRSQYVNMSNIFYLSDD